MEWTDTALVLSAQPHGETAAIATLLTRAHGRHAGLVAGGQGRSHRGILQPGNLVTAKWRARLPEHLGNFTLDPERTPMAAWLDHPLVLASVSSACAVTETSLPERQPMPTVYEGLTALLAVQDAEVWGPAYVTWEVGLLAALGYGLDLGSCALSGVSTGLSYVSPRTGRAVSHEAAAPWRDKLLPLPGFLCGQSGWSAADVVQGLELTGHFLARHVFIHPHSRSLILQPGELPAARQRLLHLYRKRAEEEVASPSEG